MLRWSRKSTRYAAALVCLLGSSREQDKTSIAANIEAQARYAKALFIWTDCDREGEHIGTEIRGVAIKGNGRLQVKRARFSNIERACVQG